MTRNHYNRRTILAGTATGVVALVAGTTLLASGRRPSYSKYTYAATEGNREALRVAWYETYNGQRTETQAGHAEANVSETLDPDTEPLYVADAPGPVIEIENALPGDSGTLHVGLKAVADDR